MDMIIWTVYDPFLNITLNVEVGEFAKEKAFEYAKRYATKNQQQYLLMGINHENKEIIQSLIVKGEVAND